MHAGRRRSDAHPSSPRTSAPIRSARTSANWRCSIRLRAVWSTPICDGDGGVLGTLAFYRHERWTPGPYEQSVVAVATHAAAVAIAPRPRGAAAAQAVGRGRAERRQHRDHGPRRRDRVRQRGVLPRERLLARGIARHDTRPSSGPVAHPRRPTANCGRRCTRRVLARRVRQPAQGRARIPRKQPDHAAAAGGRAHHALPRGQVRRHRAQAHLGRTEPAPAPPRGPRREAHGGAGAREGAGRGGQPRQGHVPGQHEPRDPHADELDPRAHLHPATGHARPGAAGAAGAAARFGAAPDARDQRHPRPLQDRGRQDRDRRVRTLGRERAAQRRPSCWRTTPRPAARVEHRGRSGVDPVLYGDPTRLSQALLNYVGNAHQVHAVGQHHAARARRARGRRTRSACGSRSTTPAPAFPRTSSASSSTRSSRAMPRRRVVTAAPGSGSRSRAVSRN